MARAPRRIVHPPAAVRLTAPGPVVHRHPPEYARRWHHVHDWAVRAVESMPGFERVELPRGRRSARVEQLAAARVVDLRDAEEAYGRGLPLELLANLPAGPRRARGGFRRVVITALTWVPDDAGEVGYDSQWITLGWGMTAHEAAAAAHRFVRDYSIARRRGVESRRLLVTALEVKFWTASAAAEYV